MPSAAHPTEIKLRKGSRVLDIAFDDGQRFELPFEYLRVHSPSAEVRGHGPGQEVLQVGKEMVGIERIDPVGNYAVRLYFDDGHNTGLYTWWYLHELGVQHKEKWQRYLARMREAGHLHDDAAPQRGEESKLVTLEGEKK